MSNLTVWERPRDYAAFEDAANPVGDYMIYSQHRDSDAIARSNYRCILRDLAAAAEKAGAPGCVYDFRAGHWAVGWVEHIILRRDAPAAVIAFAERVARDLEDYPVYSEDDWSELEYEEVANYWASMPVAERVELIRAGGNCSIFAARRDELPDCSYVYESLRD